MYAERSSVYLDIRRITVKKLLRVQCSFYAILVLCGKYECLASDARPARGKAYRPLRKEIIKIHLSWWKL